MLFSDKFNASDSDFYKKKLHKPLVQNESKAAILSMLGEGGGEEKSDVKNMTESVVDVSHHFKFADDSFSGGSKDDNEEPQSGQHPNEDRPSSAGQEPAIQIWISKSISMEDDIS